MSEVTLETLTKGAVQLYSLPDIYFQINEMINDDRFSAEDIGLVIQKDPGLSTRLLKIVNSSYYGFQARIDTIGRAITIVGLEDLQNLILATSVIDNFSKIPTDIADMTAFWIHSVNCAVIARLLARKASVLHCERLFLAGLLHDIGSLVLYTKLPDQSLEVLLAADHDRRLIAGLEQEIIGFTHADVGGGLISAWGLPESLSEAVTCYINPEMAQDFKLDAQLLFLASRLCNMTLQNSSVQEILAEVPDETTMLIRLDEDEICSVVDQSSQVFSEVFDLISPNKKFH